MELLAVCDMVEEKREQFRQTYGVPEAFEDFETMLQTVQPDVVHVSTMPTARVWEAETCAKHGVKAMVVEKPVAVRPSEVPALLKVQQETGLKIIVNAQRRYYPQFRDGVIRDIVANKIGELYFVRASAKGNMMGMGPHMMDLLLMFLGDVAPEAVWAAAHTLSDESYELTHRAPQSIMAQYWFPGGVRALFDCTPDALGTPGEQSFWMHLHFDFLGTEGRLFLTQNAGYWYQSKGMAEPVYGESSWDKQEETGQRDFTQAVADWLDGGAPHLNRLDLHAEAVRALHGAQKSVYVKNRVELPTEFSDEQWQEFIDSLR
jgi:predicted dehydrogenase